MKKIPLSKGLFALVDDEDYKELSKSKWYASVKSNGTAYAVRNRCSYDGKKGLIQMHRIVTGNIEGLLVDHINGDSLDNRRENLRICTNSENLMNRGPQKDNSTGFKGVCFHRQRQKYKAEIKKDGVKKYLGLFACPIEAAKAYDKAAAELHGGFAHLNFPA